MFDEMIKPALMSHIFSNNQETQVVETSFFTKGRSVVIDLCNVLIRLTAFKIKPKFDGRKGVNKFV